MRLLVVIDELSRYPELEIVKGTSSDANIKAFDNIFARHGFCDTLKTDNGPPFNGAGSHELNQYFKWAEIEHKHILIAEDPEASRLVELFMKHCQKVWHTSYVGGKNSAAELNKHFRMYRATPHPTTVKSPSYQRSSLEEPLHSYTKSRHTII